MSEHAAVIRNALEIARKGAYFSRVVTIDTALAALDSLVARLEQAEDALRRLASMEGFEGAGWAGGDSFVERELRARGRFAEETLALLTGDCTQSPPASAPDPAAREGGEK